MRLQKITYATVLLLLFLSTQFLTRAYAKDPEVGSVWTARQITLDGLRGDWPEGSLSTLPDREASLGLCNDSENVYVMLSFRNPQWARLIKMSGLTVWLDPAGKKKKIFMVKLVGGPSREEMMRLSGRNMPQPSDTQFAAMQERMGERFRKNDTLFSCSQEDYLVEKPIPLSGDQGPAAAFAVDKDFFVYEFKIPLKESSVLYYGLGAKPGKPISIGLIWGDVDREKMRGEGGGFHGGMGGGRPGGGGEPGDIGSGMPGGGMPGGPPGGMGGFGGRQMAQKQEVWVKATLTTPTPTN